MVALAVLAVPPINDDGFGTAELAQLAQKMEDEAQKEYAKYMRERLKKDGVRRRHAARGAAAL